MKVVSVSEMQSLDRQTIDGGISAEALMKHAGIELFTEIARYIEKVDPRFCQEIFVLTGKGNNAGDGFVIAKCLAEAGNLPVNIISVCKKEELSDAAAHHAALIPGSVDISLCEEELPWFAEGSLLIDCMLGTGFTGELRGAYSNLINAVNESGCLVISVDIPSGLPGDADTQELAEVNAVVADLTITIAQPKSGLLTPLGLQHCGTLKCVDIGIPFDLVDEVPGKGEAIFAEDIKPLLQRRPRHSHKKSFGNVSIVGGSRWFPGAPQLAATGALRSGSGYVKLVMPEATGLNSGPNAIIRNFVETRDGYFDRSCLGELEAALTDSHVVVFGPGVGRCDETVEVLDFLLKMESTLVLDADALYLLTKLEGFSGFTQPVVLTPHPGEMEMLLERFLPEELDSPREFQAAELARRLGACVVLKGAGTVVATPDGFTTINTSGNEALATAGSGDVLAGMIGAFVAESLVSLKPLGESIRVAVYIHGYTAEVGIHSTRSLIADDLPDLIAEVYRELTPFA